MRKALGMVLVAVNIQSLAAHIALAARVVLVRSNFDHFIVFHLDFKSAVLGTQYAGCFMPLIHDALLDSESKWWE
jgi:hypothetical protein